jgi:hypothetical protein
MIMTERSGSTSVPSSLELQLIIGLLTLMIKIGRYLPYVVFVFATVSLTLAVLDFAVWGNLLFGVLNTMLAIGGFVLTGQLLRRRIINRSESLTNRHDRTVAERTVMRPKMNEAVKASELRDLEAA